jgi:hypothetical protein
MNDVTFPCAGCGRDFKDNKLTHLLGIEYCEFCRDHMFCKECLSQPCGFCKSKKEEESE